MSLEAAPDMVARALSRRLPDQRLPFLKELIAHAVGAQAAIEGRTTTAESLYRAADQLVSTTPPR
jgi:hypothetical protein